MSTNNLTSEEQLLLEIASGTLSSEQKKLAPTNIRYVYDDNRSSVYNYVKCCIPKQHTNPNWKAKNLPGTLIYLHYLDWLNSRYPHILKHSYDEFRDELLQHVNHYFHTNHELYYFLITNTKVYMKYTDHPYIKMLNEQKRLANLAVKKKTYQRKKREKKEAWLKKLQYK